MELSNKILSDITVYMKYARFLEDENRRETWEELVTRNMDMHLKRYPELELIQYQMTQKPMLRCEVGARSLRASSHA